MSDADPWEIQCMEVEGVRDRQGYGRGSVRVATGERANYRVYQHRIAWEQAWGLTLKPGQVVRHTCDNPGCVNPLHLQVGTPGDNARDMVTRGRQSNQRKTHCPKGHALEEGNLDTWSYLARGVRRCRECRNAARRALVK